MGRPRKTQPVVPEGNLEFVIRPSDEDLKEACADLDALREYERDCMSMRED